MFGKPDYIILIAAPFSSAETFPPIFLSPSRAVKNPSGVCGFVCAGQKTDVRKINKITINKRISTRSSAWRRLFFSIEY